MRYLGLALYAEGPGDYQFLSPLLQRLCDALCREAAMQPVDIGDIVGLDHSAAVSDRPRAERILDAARAHAGAWQLLFVHGDGAADPMAARARLTQPALDLLAGEFGGRGRGVAVVPIRETEAWAICDGDALREVFGSTLDDRQLGLPPSPRDAETVVDPKRLLAEAFSRSNPSPRRLRRGVSPMLNALGGAVSLVRLRQLSAFQLLEAELRQALKDLRVLR